MGGPCRGEGYNRVFLSLSALRDFGETLTQSTLYSHTYYDHKEIFYRFLLHSKS